jgi:hypothetical protein
MDSLVDKICQDTDLISDGYHTFGELYEHRNMLLAVVLSAYFRHSWKSKFHEDGTMHPGFFIAGMSYPGIGQISYHVKDELWDLFAWVREVPCAPPWDGHTPDEVLDRLAELAAM